MRMLIVLAAALSLWVVLASTLVAEERVTSELYRERLSEDEQIVVIRTPVAVTPALRRLLDLPSDLPKLDVFAVAVNLHSTRTAPVLLASKLQWETAAPNTGFTVLQIAREPGAIILPVLVGTDIGVWRIQFRSASTEALAWLKNWQVSALGHDINKDAVRVKLSRMDDGGWSVEVTDLRAGSGQPTRYEQEGTEWRFRLTKSARKGK